MDYLVGDLQGCCDAFERLLAKIDFSPSRDRVFVLGDLVNRGPQSLATLERLHALGGAATCLLGNHDLHLLAVAHGVRGLHRGDTFDDILQSPQRERSVIVFGAMEAALTPLMERIEAQFAGVRVFSLPSVDHPQWGRHIELGVKGRAELLEPAYRMLLDGLDVHGAKRGPELVR